MCGTNLPMKKSKNSDTFSVEPVVPETIGRTTCSPLCSFFNKYIWCVWVLLGFLSGSWPFLRLCSPEMHIR